MSEFYAYPEDDDYTQANELNKLKSKQDLKQKKINTKTENLKSKWTVFIYLGKLLGWFKK